jgi:hypothetical protein
VNTQSKGRLHWQAAFFLPAGGLKLIPFFADVNGSEGEQRENSLSGGQ